VRKGTAPAGSVPEPIDGAVVRFERLSYRLVLLDEIDRPSLEAEVASFEAAVRDHVRVGVAIDPTLSEDHRRLLDSLEVLGWLLGIVRRDDHGGNRQALGQYGKILTEAFRRHRRHEAAAVGVASTPRTPGRPSPPGQP
jgi:hypothetical protein